MLLGVGRIAGVSGIAARAAGLADAGMSRSAAFAFLIGLPLGAYIMTLLVETREATFFEWPYLVVAGVVVGVGTRIGSGCTSGHGVCGMSRLSARSIVATAVFIATGIATVAFMNLMGLGG